MSELLQLIFTIAASVFDVAIVMIFLEIVLKDLQNWAVKPICYFIYLLLGIGFWFIRIPNMTWIFFILLGLIEYFVFTLMYKSNIIAKIFAAISLQVFSMLSEVAANSIMTFMNMLVPSASLSQDAYLYTVMLSKLIKFIMVIIVLLIMKKDSVRANVKDYLCLIIIPLLSIFIIVAVTIESKGTVVNAGVTTNTAILGILVINFIVYYLLNNIIQANEIREKQTQLETQFMFQEKKYEQTSMSFKSISSIIHDTNKHLVYLRECAVQQSYKEAIDYIDKAIDNVKKSYKKVNTGYLVIDALVSNAFNTAEANKIRFKTDISIDKSKINIERYDLSVALGNLLDNAIEACKKIRNLDDRYIDVNIFMTDTALVLNILNSAEGINTILKLKSDKPDKVRHGYGLSNVNRISEKYGGSFTVERKESKFEATIVLPLLDE